MTEYIFAVSTRHRRRQNTRNHILRVMLLIDKRWLEWTIVEEG
jgi:hypothetical protein